MKFSRLKQAIGPVRLINARQGGPEVDFVKQQSLDLDEGMAMYYQGQLYHGGECLHLMALLSTQHGLFNRVTAWFFSSPGRARISYPTLRRCRNVVLHLLGRQKISGSPF
jgi:hypothetical protein